MSASVHKCFEWVVCWSLQSVEVEPANLHCSSVCLCGPFLFTSVCAVHYFPWASYAVQSLLQDLLLLLIVPGPTWGQKLHSLHHVSSVLAVYSGNRNNLQSCSIDLYLLWWPHPLSIMLSSERGNCHALCPLAFPFSLFVHLLFACSVSLDLRGGGPGVVNTGRTDRAGDVRFETRTWVPKGPEHCQDLADAAGLCEWWKLQSDGSGTLLGFYQRGDLHLWRWSRLGTTEDAQGQPPHPHWLGPRIDQMLG